MEFYLSHLHVIVACQKTFVQAMTSATNKEKVLNKNRLIYVGTDGSKSEVVPHEIKPVLVIIKNY